MTDDACTGFAFDTYEREIERYGGEKGMLASEGVFLADSPAVAEMLRMSREDGISFDMTTLAILSIDDLLDEIGLNAEQRTDVYRQAASPSRHDGEQYRRRQRELRWLLGFPGAVAESPGGEALAALLAARRAALEPAAALLTSLEHDNLLHRPLADLCPATFTCTLTGFSARTQRTSNLPCSCSGAPMRGCVGHRWDRGAQALHQAKMR